VVVVGLGGDELDVAPEQAEEPIPAAPSRSTMENAQTATIVSTRIVRSSTAEARWAGRSLSPPLQLPDTEAGRRLGAVVP
jgi:hypothetical protein